MGTFKSHKLLNGPPMMIPMMGKDLVDHFESLGYEVKGVSLISGGYDISISKGGAFKALFGLRTALKINLIPRMGQIGVDAGVGIFGQQFVPSFITAFLFWPIIITQVWGMVQNSRLDEIAIEVAEKSLIQHLTESAEAKNFCPECGKSVPISSKFCSNCGAPMTILEKNL